MASPANPTLNAILTQGMQRGGQLNPSATQITEATTHFLAEVKSDIRHFAGRHPLLKTSRVTSTTKGVSRYTQPGDVDTIETVVLLSGPDKWHGTAQSGATQSLTLATTVSEDSDTMIGKFLLTTAVASANAAASNQYAQITGWTNATQIASVDVTWPNSNPTSTSTYLVVDDHYRLYEISKGQEWDYLRAPYGLSRPKRAAIVAEQLWLDYAPDKEYGLWWTYWADLDRLDEAGDLFVKLLREWRSLWIQGIATYTAQRYDDERYPTLAAGYQTQLMGLSTKTCTVDQVRFWDV